MSWRVSFFVYGILIVRVCWRPSMSRVIKNASGDNIWLIFLLAKLRRVFVSRRVPRFAIVAYMLASSNMETSAPPRAMDMP